MAASDDVFLKRLRWRCRRGTKELDELLGWWLDDRYGSAEPVAREAFDALLNEPDPELWDWILGHGRPPRADWQGIIDAIRSQHRL